MDRPIGTWLLLMPCLWSAALAAGVADNLSHLPSTLILFAIGALVMRGAGCTWNDITDRDLDAKVERTRSRPIPAGQVTAKQAVVFLALQLLVGLVVLAIVGWLLYRSGTKKNALGEAEPGPM